MLESPAASSTTYTPGRLNSRTNGRTRTTSNSTITKEPQSPTDAPQNNIILRKLQQDLNEMTIAAQDYKARWESAAARLETSLESDTRVREIMRDLEAEKQIVATLKAECARKDEYISSLEVQVERHSSIVNQV
jgi:hypothetical protein